MLPADFSYFITVYAPPHERIQTVARDHEGRIVPSPIDGRFFHHVVPFREFLKTEAARLKRQIGQDTAIHEREDGEIALYAKRN